MKMCVLAGAASLAVSGIAAAGFTGTAVNLYQVDSFNVYDVYVTFDGTGGLDDVLLNVYNATTTFTDWGIFNHNDIIPGGTWAPQFVFGANNDSFLTIGGDPVVQNSTNPDNNWGAAGFGQMGIPHLAGWFNSSPSNLQGTSAYVDAIGSYGTLIGRFVVDTVVSFDFTLDFEITYNQGIGTGSNQVEGSFTIPSPGAVALLGLAGLVGRRRRA